MNAIKKIIFIFILLIPNITFANSKLSCKAKHLDTDEEVEVKTTSSLPTKKIATAQWPFGYPTIAIDESVFVKLPANARQFIYYHECAHLKFQIKSEQEADCKGLELMINKHELSEIDVRQLVNIMVKEFGLSPRWTNLLNCESFPE